MNPYQFQMAILNTHQMSDLFRKMQSLVDLIYSEAMSQHVDWDDKPQTNKLTKF